ncbi:MAG: polyheme membrane-associated cytochrome C [Rhodobacteraceae bacterium]|nr:polyheme membrane-associated cytochrome C [Paracoccaceae bacterium]
MSTVGAIDHPVMPGTVVDCTSCHNAGAATLAAVPFPSGATVSTFGKSAVCAVCHQGRASTATVQAATSGMDEDTVSADLGFINVHYAPSAATGMGTVVKAGFEYPDKVYKGEFAHVPDFKNCTDCHRPHSLQVSFEGCTTCHKTAEEFAAIRISPVDFDGDGDTTEGIANPIATLHARLDEAIRLYASEVAQAPVVYSSAAFPYFFNDGNADGVASEDEAAFPNRYQSWTPRLLKAAYNYQLVAKETAIYTHNPHYALQLLYDSLEDLSAQVDVDMTGLARP